MARKLEEKDRELDDLRRAKDEAEIEKDEKLAKSEALDSALGKLTNSAVCIGRIQELIPTKNTSRCHNLSQ